MWNRFLSPVFLLLSLFFCGSLKGQDLPWMEQLPFQLQNVKVANMAEFNGDDLMDLVTVSNSSPYRLTVFGNNGDDTFTEKASFPAFENSQLEIVDVNQDNIPDIFLFGKADADSIGAKILFGQSDFSFQDENLTLDLTSLSAWIWMDFNADGLPDLLTSGTTRTTNKVATSVLTQQQEGFTKEESVFNNIPIYRINQIPWPEPLFYVETYDQEKISSGLYFFTNQELISAEVAVLPLKKTVLAQGDLNHDGYWDLFISGTDEAGIIRGGLLYGSKEGFEYTSLDLGNLVPEQAEIIDLTNDGLSEILLLGKEDGQTSTFVASEVNSYSLTKLPISTEHFFLADYVKDGKPDFLFLESGELLLYKNIAEGENLPPIAPETYLSLPLKEGVLLSWIHGTDDKTPKEALSYEIMLLDKENNQVYSSSLINMETGHDRKFGFGAIGTELIYQIPPTQNQSFDVLLSTFDNAHHTALPSCLGFGVGTGGIGTNSSCVNQHDENVWVCEESTASLAEFFEFDAQYWVSFNKGYLGKSEVEFEFTEQDILYGIRIEGKCIELFTGFVTFGENKETAFYELQSCEGDSIWLSSSIPSKSVSWLDGSGNVLGSEDSLLFVAQNSDTIFMKREPLSGACVATDTFVVEVFPKPKIQVMENTTIRTGEEIRLEAWGAEEIEWFPKEGLLNPNDPNPIVQPQTSTTYYVTGRNGTGCEVQDSVTVTILKDFFVPSLFSPNSDGRNDRLSVLGSGIKEIDFRIYDKNGNQVFKANSPQEAMRGWDGNLNGRPLPAGNYAWEFKGFFEDGSPLQFESKSSGFITLIR